MKQVKGTALYHSNLFKTASRKILIYTPQCLLSPALWFIPPTPTPSTTQYHPLALPTSHPSRTHEPWAIPPFPPGLTTPPSSQTPPPPSQQPRANQLTRGELGRRGRPTTSWQIGARGAGILNLHLCKYLTPENNQNKWALL